MTDGKILKGFKHLILPKNFEYSSDSDSLPIEFYLNVFPLSKQIDLKLGYFSTKALRLLAYGFARFIYNGGTLRIITNHYLYNSDRKLLDNAISNESELDLTDLEQIKTSLTGEEEHFFDCLRYLIKESRLEIVPVMLKPGRMAHYKQGVFTDFHGDQLFIDGSCNFTGAGLLENGESISVFRSWGSDYEKSKILSKKPQINRILEKNDEKYEYLNHEKILDAISTLGKERDVEELLSQSNRITEKETSINYKLKRLLVKEHESIAEEIKKTKETPRFPFNSKPRPYQEEAYENWRRNDHSGLFAMATGTGKTITALNSLLRLWQQEGFYQSIILAPSKALVSQWIDECKLFNFKNIIEVSSRNGRWVDELNTLCASILFNKKVSFIIVSTYSSFSKSRFQSVFKKIPSTALFIADEAHNIASQTMLPLLDNLHLSRRIALSATPTRQFDPEGNAIIERVFNTQPPYTYSFSMRQAIDEEFLCRYIYKPYITYLDDSELDAYKEISRKLLSFFDSESQKFQSNPIVQKLLIQRKSIIHKAKSKTATFRRILRDVKQQHGILKNALVYIPEGVDEDDDHFMDKFLNIFQEEFNNEKAVSYTSESLNKEAILDLFESGIYNAVFSMKCLDEGVDIPRAEIAIFCSSTGNPRQFIQRRGRVLRKHPEKDKAFIYDIIVLPRIDSESEFMSIERKLVKDEMTRVIYFSSLSENYYQIMDRLNAVCEDYDLNIYSLQSELEENL